MTKRASSSSGSRRAAYRFVIRLCILTTIAVRRRGGTLRTFGLLPTLCLLAGAVCLATALHLRGSLAARELAHWDEAAVFVLLGLTLRGLG